MLCFHEHCVASLASGQDSVGGFQPPAIRFVGSKPTVPAEYPEASLRNIHLPVPQQHVVIVGVCVCVCVDDGWFNQPHLAPVTLIGLWGWVRLHNCGTLSNQCAQVKPGLPD